MSGAHWIATRQHDALVRREIARDRRAHVVEIIEVACVDDLRQELRKSRRVEQTTATERWANESAPSEALAYLGHLVDGHTRRVREPDDRARARATDDVGPNPFPFQNAQDADVGKPTYASATEGQTHACHSVFKRRAGRGVSVKSDHRGPSRRVRTNISVPTHDVRRTQG